ncbi:protein YciZ/DeoL [Enterobacter hormaechei]
MYATTVAQRIRYCAGYSVAGDYHSLSVIFEILKSELLAENGADNAPESTQPKAPWEV